MRYDYKRFVFYNNCYTGGLWYVLPAFKLTIENVSNFTQVLGLEISWGNRWYAIEYFLKGGKDE
jgi:hypothetical protein